MANISKKHEYLLPVARIFTRSDADAYDPIPFHSSSFVGDEGAPVLASPTNWSTDAVGLMERAAYQAIPLECRAIEENTVPSWLWSHKGRGEGRETEGDLRLIFNRAVGSAAAKAWKLGFFTSEKHARAFYDETRYLLMQRTIGVSPEIIAPWGLAWAYGSDETKDSVAHTKVNQNQSQLSNATIDSLTGKSKKPTSSPLWKKIFTVPQDKLSTVTLRLSDIAADWHSSNPTPAAAAIDLMAVRHNDGSINIHALRHATRLLALLLDLQDQSDVTISFFNLAPLLLALGLAYDSEAARALAASLAAVITAECVAASAEMAALRGASEAFKSDRDAIMRSLRNHRRAAYGDGNDYEKLSVLPAPLPLKSCPDLALASEAQRRWDEALEGARVFGLRATQATDLTPSPTLSLLMNSTTQGLEPMGRLTSVETDEADQIRTVLHPSIGEALTRLDYPRSAANTAIQHIIGVRCLYKSPIINHESLRALGFTDTALEKVESYLPCVDSVKLAITPWIVGLDFCRTKLKIPAKKLEQSHFDLLKYLGFTESDIKLADLSCYGHGTAHNAKALHLRHRPLFACGREISAEARIRMAAAVQSFISGDTGVRAHLPTSHNAERGAEITLSAWRRGLKSLTIVFDPALLPSNPRPSTGRRIRAASKPHAKPFSSPPRRSENRKNASLHGAKKAPSSRRSSHKV